jgi:uncharacterized protein YndB with AHSA1/START domain
MDKSIATPSNLLLQIHQEVEINADAQTVFDAILDQAGPGFTGMDGKSLHLKLEAWPGGRWFRDLGNNTGHLWGHVQVIKPPTLLELYGPMMMSFAAISHVQYRLTEKSGATLLSLTHRAMGDIPAELREGMTKGWSMIVSKIKDKAQR